jgi:hypothetical protein
VSTTFGVVTPASITVTSEWQTPQACTRTITSPARVANLDVVHQLDGLALLDVQRGARGQLLGST